MGRPSSGALVLAGMCGIDLSERGHDLVEVFGSDADPGIGDRELQASVALDFGAQGDLAALGRELDGVGQEVDHDLFELLFNAPQAGEATLVC